MDLLKILTSKPHNSHYLTRYLKLIEFCKNQNIEGYRENHHICPKSDDLFPEYSNLRENPWNSIMLTARQHFLAHWLLWKIYKGKQTYAFHSMVNGFKTSKQERYSNLSKSRTYELLRLDFKKTHSKFKIGKSNYKDKMGNSFHVNVSDERVISGELVSTSSNRKYEKRSDISRQRSSISAQNRWWESNPIRKQNLYFLETKIVIEYTRYDYNFLEYIEQGWSTYPTPEFRSSCSKNNNKFISKESLKSRGKSISETIKKKKLEGTYKPQPYTLERRMKIRTKFDNIEDYFILAFNLETKKFDTMDPLSIDMPWIPAFKRGPRRNYIFDIDDKLKYLDDRIEILPKGYFRYRSNQISKIFNIIDKTCYTKKSRDLLEHEIVIKVSNISRIRCLEKESGDIVYWDIALLKQFGIPINYIVLSKT